jgi:hypothetical protein
MPDIEVKEPRTIVPSWNLPCEACKAKTTNFYLRENARLCNDICLAKWKSMPHKKTKSESKNCDPTCDEVRQMETPEDKQSDEDRPKRRGKAKGIRVDEEWVMNVDDSNYSE